MTLLAIERHPRGPRVRFAGLRVHHGAFGCLLAVFKRTRGLGLALCLHDLPDIRRWFAGGWQD